MKNFTIVLLILVPLIIAPNISSATEQLCKIKPSSRDAAVMVQAEKYLIEKPNLISSIVKNRNELIGFDSPSCGPSSADVVVVEFFDYQCLLCAKMFEKMEFIRKTNNNVRIIFRPWPVMKRRWAASLDAARTGLQLWRQKGNDDYLKWHSNIFATGHNEGELTTADISTAAANLGFDATSAPDVEQELQRTDDLATELGFLGTPAFIILPTKNIDIRNVTVLPGAVEKGVLQSAINKAMNL